jgi:hypothetical protein
VSFNAWSVEYASQSTCILHFRHIYHILCHLVKSVIWITVSMDKYASGEAVQVECEDTSRVKWHLSPGPAPLLLQCMTIPRIASTIHLKGTVSQDFRPLIFFHQTIPAGPLIHGLKPFRIRLRIREVFRQSRCLTGVISTQRCHWHCWGIDFVE